MPLLPFLALPDLECLPGGCKSSESQIVCGSKRVDTSGLAKLAEAVRLALIQERASCEAQVVGGNISSADLWEDMPTVDSKTVARLAPIFKRHTGRYQNIRRIRPGGYDSVEEAVQDLGYGDDDSN